MLNVLSEIDAIIHGTTRLAIVSALAAHQALTFAELRETLEVSDGNLSAQLRRLEDAAYITAERSFVRRMPQRSYSLTTAGAEALRHYFDCMSALMTWTLERWKRNDGID